MSVNAIEQVRSVAYGYSAEADTQTPVSLSARVAAQQESNEVGDAPAVSPILDPDLEDIYQWLVANQDTMNNEPKTMIEQLIKKVQAITNPDGSKTYVSLDGVWGFCMQLKTRFDQGDVVADDFLNMVNVTVFGLNMMYENIKQTTFFHPNEFYTDDDPMY